MLFTTITIFCPLFVEKEIWLPCITATLFICPFDFLLGDLIAEIYGYKSAVKFYFALVIMRYFLAAVCEFLLSFPSPEVYQQQMYYNFIFNHFMSAFIIHPIALSIAWLINIKLITKWKILLKGEYFWMRSVGSSAIAETLFAIFLFLILSYPTFSSKDVQMVFVSVFFRIFFTFIFAFPSTIILNIIKIIEKVNFNENDNNFNPFKKKSIET